MKGTLDLESIRQKLEAERAELRNRIAEVTRQLDAPEDQAVEVIDLADTAVTRQLQTTLLEQSQQQLQHIEAALRRLAEGRYGVCERCGQAIRPQRLRVLPYATTCVKCQKELEQIHGPHLSVA
jgi:DnaK suppressor protein